MRIGYFADGPWAHQALHRILTMKSIEVAFIMPRYDTRDPVLIEMAEEKGIPCLFQKNINSSESHQELSSYNCDLFVSLSFNQIFRQKTIDLPPLKTINVHCGKLPFYRGRNILNWALINDEKEFGITVHYIDPGIDTGDIILQDTLPITDADDYGTLLERAYAGCAKILPEALELFTSNQVKAIKQTAIHPTGFYCGGRKEGDENLNWNSTSREIFNFTRAICSPGPNARTQIGDDLVKIKQIALMPDVPKYAGIPGQVVGKEKDGFIVKTADTVVKVTRYSSSKIIRIGDRLNSNT